MKNNTISGILNIINMLIWLFVPQVTATVHRFSYIYDANYSPVILLFDGVYENIILLALIVITIVISLIVSITRIANKSDSYQKVLCFIVPISSVAFDLLFASGSVSLIRDSAYERVSVFGIIVVIITATLALSSNIIIKKQGGKNNVL